MSDPRANIGDCRKAQCDRQRPMDLRAIADLAQVVPTPRPDSRIRYSGEHMARPSGYTERGRSLDMGQVRSGVRPGVTAAAQLAKIVGPDREDTSV